MVASYPAILLVSSDGAIYIHAQCSYALWYLVSEFHVKQSSLIHMPVAPTFNSEQGQITPWLL